MADWFVASVAFVLGFSGLVAASTQADWPLRWSIANLVNRFAGRNAMRVAYVCIGVMLILIGASILWRSAATQKSLRQASPNRRGNSDQYSTDLTANWDQMGLVER